MSPVEFQPWPKIPRLASPFIITEKIDGTNGAVVIASYPWTEKQPHEGPAPVAAIDSFTEARYFVYAQSRKRFITPGDDNFGFAAWVKANAEALVRILGPGRHFGEWWGSGIQRGYGLLKGERRFSLFNVTRHNPLDSMQDLYDRSWPVGAQNTESLFPGLPSLGLVPVLDFQEDDWDLADQGNRVDYVLHLLAAYGSHVVPGFDKPEGVVLFHSRSSQTFKAFVDDSEKVTEVALRKSDLELAA